jgi:hypothetical protein
MHRDVKGSFDPDPNLSPFDVDYGDFDTMAENEAFPSLAC